MIQKALQEVLYAGKQEGGLSTTRLAVLLNSALGVVARSSSAFIDFDSLPDDAIDLKQAIQYLFSERAKSLRTLLEEEAISAGDILLRQFLRKSFNQISARTNSFRPPIPFLNRFLPNPLTTSAPFLIPAVGSTTLTPIFVSPNDFIEAAAPKLTREEELYAISLTDLASQTLGRDVATVVNGDVLVEPLAVLRLVLTALSQGELPSSLGPLNSISSSILARLTNTPSGLEFAGTANNFATTINELGSLDEDAKGNLRSSLNKVSKDLVEKLSHRLQQKFLV